MLRAPLLLVALAGALAVPAGAGALTLEEIGTGFSSPVFVTSDPADENRLFVVERGGTIKLVENGTTSTFLDLTSPEPDLLVSGGERGLLSMAFAPDFESSGLLYVFYTRNGTGDDLGDLQLDEYTASGDSVSVATRRPVLTIDHESSPNHNGGQLQFGPDDHLYLSTGDGGGPNDPENNAQDTTSLLGKILRINPSQSGVDPYTVPPDNPFVGAAGADEIWSYGLRNPWRFSFDRATGDLLIGDVGQAAWEEIDHDPAPDAGGGVNFGWDCREGRHPGGSPSPDCPASGFTDPIFEYQNPFGPSQAAVVGGYVARDPSLGQLNGRYVYSDTFSGEIRSLCPALPTARRDRSEGVSVDMPSSFGEDAAGRLYVASLAGAVYRLEGTGGDDCDPLPARSTCKGTTATIVTEAGERTEGTRGSDVIVGTPRRDRINASRGDDLICAGKGWDRVRAAGGNDLVRGERGADRLGGGPGADVLRGGPGRDRCSGGPGADAESSC